MGDADLERGKMDEALKTIGDKVAGALPGAITGVHFAFGELTILAEPSRILEVLTFLRDDPSCQFICFTDICGADYPDREKRFDILHGLRFYLTPGECNTSGSIVSNQSRRYIVRRCFAARMSALGSASQPTEPVRVPAVRANAE